MDIPNSIYSV